MKYGKRRMQIQYSPLPPFLLPFLLLFLMSCSALEAKREMANFNPDSIPNLSDYSYYRWYMTYFFGYEVKPGEKAPPKERKHPKYEKPVSRGFFPESPPSIPSPYHFQPEVSNARGVPGALLFSWDVPEKLIWGHGYSGKNRSLFFTVSPDGKIRTFQVPNVEFIQGKGTATLRIGLPIPYEEVAEPYTFYPSIPLFPLHSLGGSGLPERYLIYSTISQKLMVFDGEGKLLSQEPFCRWRFPEENYEEFVLEKPKTWIRWEIPPPVVDFLPVPLRKEDPPRLLAFCPSSGSLAILNEKGQFLSHIHIRQPTLPPLFTYDWKSGEGFIAVPLTSGRVLIYDRFGNQTARLNPTGIILPVLSHLSYDFYSGYPTSGEMDFSMAYEGAQRFWVLTVQAQVFVWDMSGKLVRSYFIPAGNLSVGEVQPGLTLIGADGIGDDSGIAFYDLKGRRVTSLKGVMTSSLSLVSLDLNFDGMKEFYLSNPWNYRNRVYFPLQGPHPGIPLPLEWKPEGELSASPPISRISIPLERRETDPFTTTRLSIYPASENSILLCTHRAGEVIHIGSQCWFVRKNEKPLKTTFLSGRGLLGPDLNGDGIRDFLSWEKTESGAVIEARSLTGKTWKQWKATFDSSRYEPSELSLIRFANKWYLRLGPSIKESDFSYSYREYRNLYFLHDPANPQMISPILEKEVPEELLSGARNTVVLDGLDIRPILTDATGSIPYSYGERPIAFSNSEFLFGPTLGYITGALQSTWLLDSFGKVSLKIPDVEASFCTLSLIPDEWTARTAIWSCDIPGGGSSTTSQSLVFIVEKGGYGVGLYEARSLFHSPFIPVTMADLFGDGKPDLIGAVVSNITPKEWVVDLLHLPTPPMNYP